MMIKRTVLLKGLLTFTLLTPSILYGQLIDTHSVTRQIDDLGRRAVDASREVSEEISEAARAARAQARVAQAQAHDAALDPIARALDNPLAQLPNALPILDIVGQLAHVEVIVEDGWRAVAREWLVWLPAGQQTLVEQSGIQVLAVEPMAGLGMALVRFRVQEALDSRAALEQLLPQSLHANLDRNHTFNSQARSDAPTSIDSGLDAPSANHHACKLPVRVGMVDTRVQISHPAFAETHIRTQTFLPADLAAPAAHGTAVASLLIGRGEGLFSPLPQAKLFAASAFYARSDYSEGATTQSLLQALNWLATEKVSVINMSLAGPPNRLLAMAVTQLATQHIAMVAAVGNEGPAAPALYPAAYAQVLAVTAVDSERNIYRWANQGAQVAFAAMGVSVLTARVQMEQQPLAYGRESGTSMAAPIITARLACALAEGLSLSDAVAQLQKQALDLGEPGVDSVFGAGLIL